ncbi:SHOCT domain-containing protein, partial [Streptomyces sp. NPDC006999]|uniref:SHOCT domain-containing protein n=1 Tax=Streptomyces sp. NPDC006999 TaxID=3156909 RepID=UPI0033F948AF
NECGCEESQQRRLTGAVRPEKHNADRIRHLGDLHQAGLVTDEEFSSKKAELLAEL